MIYMERKWSIAVLDAALPRIRPRIRLCLALLRLMLGKPVWGAGWPKANLCRYL